MKLSKLLATVTSIRALTESKGAFAEALDAFAIAVGSKIEWALGGGLAVGFHAQPRGTQDIDIFILSEEDLQRLKQILPKSFIWIRKHAIEHSKTGIEIELITPVLIQISQNLMLQVISTAKKHIVSREGLVALKLQRASNRDKGDIEDIIKVGGKVNLDGFDIKDSQRLLYLELERNALASKPLE